MNFSHSKFRGSRPGLTRNGYELAINGLANHYGGQRVDALCTNRGISGLSTTRQRHRLRIGTWNISSLTGKDLELVGEAVKYRLDIVGVSSTKQRGSGTVDLADGWKLFMSGVAQSAQAGVGILTSPRLAGRVLEWIPLGGRVAILKLKLERSSLALVQVYAPNLESGYAAFLDEVDADLEKVADMDSYILMGDFNAHVGADFSTWGSAIGKHGDPDQNANGEKFLDFCCSDGMSIMNTFFPHKDIHKYTWYRRSLQQKLLIDLCGTVGAVQIVSQ